MEAVKWLYIRLYAPPEVNVLEWAHKEFFDYISKNQKIESWFFIRFLTPGGPHLRIRMKVFNGVSREKLLNEIHNHVPLKFQIIVLPYMPEIFKWRDEKGIKTFESMSCIGSELVRRNGYLGENEEYLLSACLTSFQECASVIKSEGISPVSFFYNYSWYWGAKKISSEFSEVTFGCNTEIFSEFSYNLREMLQSIPYNYRYKFISDILHLQHNRLGIPPYLEGVRARIIYQMYIS